MNSQGSRVSTVSSVTEDCALNLEDPDLLTALKETETEFFADWEVGRTEDGVED